MSASQPPHMPGGPSPDDSPEWKPYQPPPPSRSELAWYWARRLSFPLTVMVVLAGFGALLYLTSTGNGGDEPSVEELQRQALTTPDEPSADTNGSIGSGAAILSVRSDPEEAAVLIDGDTIGTTPLEDHTIESGVYHLRVAAEGYFTADTVAVLRGDDAITYAPTLRDRPDLPGTLAEREQDGIDETLPDDASEAQEEPPPDEPADPEPDDPDPGDPEPGDPDPDVDPSPPPGSVAVTSDPEGATIEMDGEEIDTTPATLTDLEPGTYTLRLTHSGYEPVTTEVDIEPGAEATLEETLTPRMGTLRVLVRPWGSIYIDGELRERETDVWYETELPVGNYEVEVRHPSLGQAVRTVYVSEDDDPEELTIDLREE